MGCYTGNFPKMAITVKIANCEIRRTENSKYVELGIDSNMKWIMHIQNVINKVRYFAYVAKKFNYLPNKILHLINNAFVPRVHEYRGQYN